MIKFYFPRDLEKFQNYLPDEIAKYHLIMIAEEEEQIKALCAFYYCKESAEIKCIKNLEETVDLQLLDGLFRSVMFHLMEMGCVDVRIYDIPEEMKPYFYALGFSTDQLCWKCDDFPKVLFSGCPSCGE